MRGRTPVPLAGARVVVTGGGSGIGKRMAVEAASRGATVIIWELSADAAEATRSLIERARGTAEVQVVDVSDEAQVNHAAARAGAVDVLINNAGIVTGAALIDNTSDSIRRTFDINVLALYWTTRAVLPGMLERNRGVVVNVASAAGLVGVARQTDYSASKFAVVGFTESLRAELRATPGCDVGTMLVCPYYIDTGMFDGVRTRFPLLLPILKEVDVADAIINGIESRREQYIAPRLARWVPVMRVLPTCVFDRVMDFFGINHTMDHFVGRRGGVEGTADGC